MVTQWHPLSLVLSLSLSLSLSLVSHQVFRSDGGDVHSHWLDYTERMDRMVEEAFRLNVKWSLQELSRAVNGDGKTLPNPLFKVKVLLSDKIEFSPSIEEMEGYVGSISSQLIETVSVFRRLPDLLAGKKKGREVSVCLIQWPHLYSVLSN